jgi:Domain of unknown function (DUF4410)
MFFLPPQSFRTRFVARQFVILLFLAIVTLQPAKASPQSADAAASAVPILVSDFELFSVPPPPKSPATPALKREKTKTPLAYEEVEVPSVQARRLMDFFSTTLVEILQKGGYNARRTRGKNPPQGALIRGVFAETDEKNRVRRTLLGGESANSRFFLYVGIFNLARPDQPLYQLASEQPGDNQFGPVITLSNYIPLAKYELDKNPSDEDVRKACGQIAASLTALLAANANAFFE